MPEPTIPNIDKVSGALTEITALIGQLHPAIGAGLALYKLLKQLRPNDPAVLNFEANLIRISEGSKGGLADTEAAIAELEARIAARHDPQ